jgi:3D (Asp-Asp-Asp) domain-containing protein
MPLLAVAVALSTLLHATFAALTPSWSAPSLLAAAPAESSAQQGESSATATRWVAPHSETSFWSGSGGAAENLGPVHIWTPLQVVGKARNHRLPILDPSTQRQAWVDARAVGPIDPALVGTEHLPPIGREIAWSGSARITMYTCVELGGCAPTASGVWPEPGQVAVDPRVIPLGSTVWVQGLGTFVATDTGSLVRGAHLDVFSLNYHDAIAWGVQERTVQVFAPR